MEILGAASINRMWRKGACLLFACLLSIIATAPAHADERQYKLEAAFLYNFFNYITWPGYQSPDAQKRATICIDQHDAALPYLEYIEHKKPQEREITIRQLSNENINGCQVFFIRDIGGIDMEKLRATAMEKGVLLVSSSPDFIDDDGMIGFSKEDERIAIDIDDSTLRQAGFQVSSRLLSLVRRVK